MTAYKRLSLSDRCEIEAGLNQGLSLNAIAFSLSRSTSTISREIKSHRQSYIPNHFTGVRNRCVHRKSCKVQFLCPAMSKICKNKFCAHCSRQNCTSTCPDYEEEICVRLDKPPYVCNGCPKRKSCHLKKTVYKAATADKLSHTVLSESRQGISLTEEELTALDQLISPRIKKGQSLHHIMVTDADKFTIHERTAYKYLTSGLLSAKSIDAPRIVRMSPRKKSIQHKVDKKCRIGRTYDDFNQYLADNEDTVIVEGDTVEGIKGGKCILTLTWKSCDFQVAFLRERNDSASVTQIFTDLYEKLGYEKFTTLFPHLILFDNGTEFSNPAAIEKFGPLIFYTNPSSPQEKGTCENTHSLFRRICPKGTSFNDLDQEFFNLAYSHINSLVRKKLNNLSAHEMFSLMYGQQIDIFETFGIRKINPEDVQLTPSLKTEYLQEPSLNESEESDDDDDN